MRSLILLCAACTTGARFVASPVDAPILCSDDGWCVEQPRPMGEPVVALWGFSPEDVWAGGRSGTLLHFDGRTWRRFHNPLWNEEGHLAGRTNSMPEDGSTVRSIWGASSNDVWAATSLGLLHWDGRAWTASAMPDVRPRAVVGTARDDVWVVGRGPRAKHWDGKAWSAHALDNAGTLGEVHELVSLWAGSRDDVWAVGDWGHVEHWNGRNWQRVDVGAKRQLFTVFGSGHDDVWIAGAGGAIHHWNGKAWSVAQDADQDDQDDQDRRGIPHGWARASDDAWAVDQGGRVLHWDGRSWREAAHSDDRALFALWSDGARDLWIGGDWGEVARFDGRTFAALGAPPYLDLFAMWGSDERDVWAVGERGTIVHREDARHWRPLTSGSSSDLFAVSGTGPRDVWAVGAAGTALHWDGSAWLATQTGTGADLESVYAAAPDLVWAASGERLLRHDASGWHAEPGVTDPVSLVSGAARDNVWAVGEHVALHWDGTTWRRMDVEFGDLYGLAVSSAGAWVTTDDGVLALRADRNGWDRSDGGPAKCRGVWAEGDRVWAGGRIGELYELRAGGWHWSDAQTSLTANGLFGHAGHLFLVGSAGVILHREPRAGR